MIFPVWFWVKQSWKSLLNWFSKTILVEINKKEKLITNEKKLKQEYQREKSLCQRIKHFITRCLNEILCKFLGVHRSRLNENTTSLQLYV